MWISFENPAGPSFSFTEAKVQTLTGQYRGTDGAEGTLKVDKGIETNLNIVFYHKKQGLRWRGVISMSRAKYIKLNEGNMWCFRSIHILVTRHPQ